MASPEARLPIDQNTPVPPAVKAAAAAADAMHAATYGTPAPAPEAPASPFVNIVEPPKAAATPAPAPAPQPPAPPPSAPQPPKVVPEEGEPGSWEHRYLAMKGRHDQSQQTIGQLQQQLEEMGTELMKMHQQPPQQPRPPAVPNAPRPPRRLTTKDDVEGYGMPLIDLIARVAQDAVAPHLSRVGEHTQNLVQRVESRVQQTAEQTMLDHLSRDVPSWQEVNVNPRFKAWCSLRDVYSGRVRADMLRDAFQAADAPRVIAFFQGFLNEERATGQLPAAPQMQPTAFPPSPPSPAVSLETLAAPGRPKPASGFEPAAAADKPVITIAQIKAFYENVRRGGYAGRDADKLRDEQIIFSAQREGRVRG